jgi:hypothetical protein
MAARKYERVIDLLQTERDLSSPLLSLVREAKEHTDSELTSKLDALEKATVAARGKHIRRRESNKNVQEQQRSVLLRLANLHEADAPKRFQYLERWIKSFRVSGKPMRLQHLASDVLMEMAALSLSMNRLDSAISLCQESRTLGQLPEVDWIEGLTTLATGNPQLARRLFDRYGRNKSLALAERVTKLLKYLVIQHNSPSRPIDRSVQQP